MMTAEEELFARDEVECVIMSFGGSGFGVHYEKSYWSLNRFPFGISKKIVFWKIFQKKYKIKKRSTK